MADKALTLRLNKVLRELNISLDRAVEYLSNVGCEIEARPTTKISQETYELLLEGFKEYGKFETCKEDFRFRILSN